MFLIIIQDCATPNCAICTDSDCQICKQDYLLATKDGLCYASGSCPSGTYETNTECTSILLNVQLYLSTLSRLHCC